MKEFLIIPAIAVIFNYGCMNKAKELSNDKIFHIDIDNITETVDLKLSDLAENFKLIQLETTSKCLLGDYTSFYLSDTYIIAISNDGIYKFTSDGQFINKIINQGPGPQELISVAGIVYFIDEKTDYLYINDQIHPQRFIIYDIESERFLDPIDVGLPIFGHFAVYKDTLLICTYSGFSDSINSAVLFYDFKGELRSEITHNKMAFDHRSNSLSYQPSLLSFEDSTFYLQFLEDDTLYQISNNRLNPYIITNFEQPRGNPPNYPRQIGDRSVIFLNNVPCFSLISVSILEKVFVWGDVGDTESSGDRYFLNKNTGSCSIISSYTDDLIGETREGAGGTMNYVFISGILPNGKLVIPYYKYQIEEAIEKGFKSNAFDQNIIAQMYRINEAMNEMDNPVLLVGKLKKNE